MRSLRPEAYLLCLVTSRELARGQSLVDVVSEAVAGGVTMVQLREKRACTRDFLTQATLLRACLKASGIPLIINDRADIAVAIGADGVHVGQDDMPVDILRQMVGPDMLIGLSITNEVETGRDDAQQADYLGIGPLFAQSTKSDAAEPLGLDGFARLRSMTRLPVLAIGGIDAGNARAVTAAGADGLAVVSAIMSAPDPRKAAASLRVA